MGVRPKKRFGQHFLRSRKILQKIVDAIEVVPQQLLIEIGAGDGRLSFALIERFSNPLVLIEVEREACQYLRQHLPKQKRIQLFEGSFKQYKIQEPCWVVGNFPYNQVAAIAFWVLEQHSWVEGGVWMVQKEVAQRYCASPGSRLYNLLAVLLQSYYHLEYLFDVPPKAFYPPPKVYGAVIRLKRKETLPSVPFEVLKKIVKSAFSNRRKVLRNTLSTFRYPKRYAHLRAEQLSPEQFQEIAAMNLSKG